MVASSRRLLQPSCCAACVLTQYRTCSGLNAIKAHLASSEADEDSYSSSQSAPRAREYRTGPRSRPTRMVRMVSRRARLCSGWFWAGLWESGDTRRVLAKKAGASGVAHDTRAW